MVDSLLTEIHMMSLELEALLQALLAATYDEPIACIDGREIKINGEFIAKLALRKNYDILEKIEALQLEVGHEDQ